MSSLDKIMKMYINSEESQYMRLGQWFCFKFGIQVNIYADNGRDLFYIVDTKTCVEVIKKWLQDHHYFDAIPVVQN